MNFYLINPDAEHRGILLIKEVNLTTWKLTIKPCNIAGYDPFQLCKSKSLLGVGWAGAYKENQAANIADAKVLVKAEYNKWPYPIKYLLEDVKQGDHIWLHQNGNYYLCKASNEIVIGKAIDNDFISYDLGHARKATWITVPEIYVSGSIQRGTIAQRMIQRIWITEKEKEFHEILFNNLLKNPDWQPDISDSIQENEISKMQILDMFSLMSPDDVEDVVSAYLQSQGWILVKSTCFRSKPVFEFTMLNKDHETCHVQVKSGKYPNSLPPSYYSKYTAPQKSIFLFSTNQNPYPGLAVDGVTPITHNEIFDWVQKNIWSLTAPLKQRLGIFLCENKG